MLRKTRRRNSEQQVEDLKQQMEEKDESQMEEKTKKVSKQAQQIEQETALLKELRELERDDYFRFQLIANLSKIATSLEELKKLVSEEYSEEDESEEE